MSGRGGAGVERGLRDSCYRQDCFPPILKGKHGLIARHQNAPKLNFDSMDSQNLKAASAYINNLLLARGLLRNGKSVEFARPSKGDGGTEATMAQVINLVHDMILRRDVIALRLLEGIVS